MWNCRLTTLLSKPQLWHVGRYQKRIRAGRKLSLESEYQEQSLITLLRKPFHSLLLFVTFVCEVKYMTVIVFAIQKPQCRYERSCSHGKWPHYTYSVRCWKKGFGDHRPRSSRISRKSKSRQTAATWIPGNLYRWLLFFFSTFFYLGKIDQVNFGFSSPRHFVYS